MENAPKCYTFGCFKKIPTDRPKYSEIPLEGNTTIFFFGLIMHKLKMQKIWNFGKKIFFLYLMIHLFFFFLESLNIPLTISVVSQEVEKYLMCVILCAVLQITQKSIHILVGHVLIIYVMISQIFLLTLVWTERLLFLGETGIALLQCLPSYTYV